MSSTTSTRDLRRFGLALGTVLTLFGGLSLWRAKPWWPWLFAAAAVLVLLAAVVPRVLWPLEKVMAGLLRAVMTVVTYVVLTLAYLFIFTPMGLLLRLTGKDLLGRRLPTDKPSYWEPIEVDGPASRPDKPY